MKKLINMKNKQALNEHYKDFMYIMIRLTDTISDLKDDGVDPKLLLNNLEYVQQALQYLLSVNE